MSIDIGGLADVRAKLQTMSQSEGDAYLKRLKAEAYDAAETARIAAYTGLPYREVEAMVAQHKATRKACRRAFKGIA